MKKILIALAFGIIFTSSLSAQLPEDFYDQLCIGGFDFPTGVVFDEQGRGFVWEKKGLIHIIDTSGNKLPEPLLDITEEVTNWKDHGLMSVALDNGFTTNGLFYVMYAVDLHHYFNFGTPNYKPDTTRINEPTFGRVVRYQADSNTDFKTVVEGSRTILLGETLETGIPLLYDFHGLGSIIVGDDGTLLISTGDATSNAGTDIGGDSLGTRITDALALGLIEEDQDVGSYRSQYLGNYNGKILRIDANTGDGISSNPFYEEQNPRTPQSRIWAYGFRNPYRIALHPGSGSHYPADGNPGTIMAADVGNGAWEELNIVTSGGTNYGWPVYEGNVIMWAFWINDVPVNQMASNPLYNQGCDQPYFSFRDLIKAPEENKETVFSNPCNDLEPIPDAAHPAEAQFPVLAWSNAKWNKPTRAMVPRFDGAGVVNNFSIDSPEAGIEGEPFDGFSSLGGVFYTGEQFPEEYRGKYFGMDFSGWIKVFEFDDDYHLESVKAFHDDVKDIIHLALNPKDGALYYINIAGELRKISFGGNPAPIPIIEADKFYGSGPLTIQFNAEKSYDPNSGIKSYSWDFGNGQTSTDITPSMTFSSQGNTIKSYPVTLTVTDSADAAASQTVIVSVNNTPPVVNINSFEDGALYPLDKTSLLMLRADVEDREHTGEELFYQWKVYLHHNDHFHPEPTDFNPVTHMLVSPLGCQDELYYYRIELTVTDPEGLSTLDSRIIRPYCGGNFVEWTELTSAAQAEFVALDWAVTMEDSVLRYEIQRGEDFYNFTTIGEVSPKGNNSNYTYQDVAPIFGSNIYRIKAIKESGAFLYSNLSTANFPPLTGIRIYPNPASNSFNLEVKEAQGGMIQFELYSIAGMKVLNTFWNTTPGEQVKRQVISTSLPRGMYFYRVINGNEKTIGRLLLNP